MPYNLLYCFYILHSGSCLVNRQSSYRWQSAVYFHNPHRIPSRKTFPAALPLWGGVYLPLIPVPVQRQLPQRLLHGCCGKLPAVPLWWEYVGFGITFEVSRMSAVVHAFQNCYNRAFIPTVWIIGKWFPFLFCIMGACCQHFISFQNFCYLHRSFSGNA